MIWPSTFAVVAFVLQGMLAQSSILPWSSWHEAEDCSDSPSQSLTFVKQVCANSTGCIVAAGMWNIETLVDLKPGVCNATHFRMSMFMPNIGCTREAGTLAIPLQQTIDRFWRGDCVKVWSECCNGDGSLKEGPDLETVKLHEWNAMEHSSTMLPSSPSC